MTVDGLRAAGGRWAPRSALFRLTAIYALAFAAAALLFVVGATSLLREKNLERTQALIAADLESVLEKTAGPAPLRAEKAKAVVLARTARADDPRLYRVTTPGEAPVGNLPASVRLRAQGRGWLAVSSLPHAPAAERGVVQRIDLGGGELLIGRRFEDAELEREVARVAAAAFLIAAFAAFVIGPWASRRILRRVEAVNQACDRVQGGDFDARAPGEAAPDEFGALSRHVNGMLERIDALVLGLRDVSNRVAHDLRTPVARLKTNLDRVSDARSLSEAQALAAAAAAETDEILQTFQALLDIAEVEAGSDAGLKPMRLDEAARTAAELYEAVAEDRGLVLVSDLSPAPLLGERRLLVQMAANLIDNALKFAPPGGTVHVGTALMDGEAVLIVADQGPGIPAAERESVLRRFVRGRAAAGVDGHGLGLALVAAVAKRHGARVRLEDAQPGLRVVVRFRAFSGS